MIKLARERGYSFIDFDEEAIHDLDIKNSTAEHIQEFKKGQILLRHDIDADLSAAAKMANAEYTLGIKATYFLMLRSPCYNLMSRSSQKYVEEILRLNHNIGLHYDHGFDLENNKKTSFTLEQVKMQSGWLEKLFSCKVSAVSFHQPNLKLVQEINDLGGLLNTYNKYLRKKYFYISDSNRDFSLFNNIDNKQTSIQKLNNLADRYPQNLQLLIHPLWWIYDASSTEEAWNHALLNNFELSQKQLVKTERAYGPPRSIEIYINEEKY